MLSWIFRHRQRLSAIYGMAKVPALPGSRMRQAEPAPERSGFPGQPGHMTRRGRHVELRPMPPRVR